MTDQPSSEPDAIDTLASELAGTACEGIDQLLPAEEAEALEDILAVTFARHPRLRLALRRIAPDPHVAASGEIARDEDAEERDERDVAGCR